MRIGDLIEHEHDAASRYDVREVEALQRKSFEHDALMHGAGAKTAGEVLGRDDMGAEASAGDFALEPAGGGFRGINIEDFSSLTAQRLAHRVKAIKKRTPLAARRNIGALARARFCPLVPAPAGRSSVHQVLSGAVWRERIRRFFMLAGCAGLARESFDLSRVKSWVQNVGGCAQFLSRQLSARNAKHRCGVVSAGVLS